MGDQKKPEDIYKLLCNRVDATNTLWSKTTDLEVEQEKLLYFKYYMDLSVAIESTLRGIAFEYTRDDDFGLTVSEFVEPDKKTKSFFLDIDKIRALTRDGKIVENISEDEFSTYKSTIPIIANEKIAQFTNKDNAYSSINGVRNVRNKLAHGLESSNNVDYSKTTLIQFMYAFYLLHHYYSNIIK